MFSSRGFKNIPVFPRNKSEILGFLKTFDSSLFEKRSEKKQNIDSAMTSAESSENKPKELTESKSKQIIIIKPEEATYLACYGVEQYQNMIE